MKNKYFVAILGVIILLVSSETLAIDQVIRCDSCASPSSTAINTKSAGLKIIADYKNKKINGYGVEYDIERRKWLVLPQAIPSGIQQSFNTITSSVFAASGGVVVVHVGKPNQLINQNSAFNDSNAYEIVQSATLRSSLGRELALNWSAANSSSTSWNDLGIALTSLSLSVLSKTGIGEIIFRLEFQDGSVAYYQVKSDTAAQATYTPGQSNDSDGNKIADSSVSGGAGREFTGIYDFSSPGNLQDWINTAIMNGVKVVEGKRTNALSCSWDGEHLNCKYI